MSNQTKPPLEESVSQSNEMVLSTSEVAWLVRRSTTCMLRWVERGVFPDYATPYKVHAKQRGLFWPREGVMRFLDEQQKAAGRKRRMKDQLIDAPCEEENNE